MWLELAGMCQVEKRKPYFLTNTFFSQCFFYGIWAAALLSENNIWRNMAELNNIWRKMAELTEQYINLKNKMSPSQRGYGRRIKPHPYLHKVIILCQLLRFRGSLECYKSIFPYLRSLWSSGRQTLFSCHFPQTIQTRRKLLQGSADTFFTFVLEPCTKKMRADTMHCVVA